MKYLLTYLFIFLSISSFTQITSRIDSLENELNNNFGEKRIELFNTLAESYYRISVGKTIEYSYFALQLSQQLGNKIGEANSLSVLSYANSLIHNFEIANEYIDRSIEIYRELGSKAELVKAIAIKANILVLLRETEEGEKLLLEARELNNKYAVNQLFPLLFTGDFYLANKNFNKALLYYTDALDKKFYTQIPDYKIVTNLKIAECYTKLNNFDKAFSSLSTAIASAAMSKSDYEKVNSYIKLSEVLIKQKKFNEAIDTLNISKKISTKIRFKVGMHQTLKLLSVVYAELNDYKTAYLFYNQFVELSDSIDFENNTNRIDNLSVEYEADQQEQELLLIQREKEIQKLENARQLAENKRQKSLIYLFVSLIVILLLISFFIYSRFRYKQTSEKRFKQLYNATFEGILIIENKVIVEANNKIAELSGWHRNDLIGKHITSFIDSTLTFDTDAEKKEVEENYETVLQKQNGSNIDVEILEKPFTYKGKQVRVVAIRDISERKKSEEALRKSELELRELNAMKDKMFSIIGHDLKGNFWNFKIVFDTLWDEIFEHDPEQLKEILNSLKDAADATYNLLENLLNWARLQRGQLIFAPEKLSLKRVVNDNIKLLKSIANGKGIELKNDVHGEIEILADKNMIHTVVRNLVANALKFTKKEGSVRIMAIAGTDKVEVTVADTGVGISPENMRKLFNSDGSLSTFGTNNEKGSGLGLILCKEFVEKSGGEIWVESIVGKGSKFKFTIPTAVKKTEIITKREVFELQPI